MSQMKTIERAIERVEQAAHQVQQVAQEIQDQLEPVQYPLTSAEIAALWTQYLNETAGLCMNRFLVEHIKDAKTKALFEYAIDLSHKHIDSIKMFVSTDGFPVPVGFTNDDVIINAPPLFSDIFSAHYLNVMSLHGCHGYSAAITTSSRKDVRNYFTECNASAVELCNRSKDLLIEQGIYFRPPALIPPSSSEMVKSDSFLSGWFHETRPISCIEITDIIFNLKKSLLAEALAVAFAQVAHSKKVRSFLAEAVHTKEKHIGMFNQILEEQNLPAPPNLVSEIRDSTTSPFSDKLMMFVIGFLYSSAMVYYGSGLASSPNKHLLPKYLLAIGDDINVSANWVRTMIEHGWLEQPPLAEDRKALSKQ